MNVAYPAANGSHASTSVARETVDRTRSGDDRRGLANGLQS
jgi:hypothetical protein